MSTIFLVLFIATLVIKPHAVQLQGHHGVPELSLHEESPSAEAETQPNESMSALGTVFFLFYAENPIIDIDMHVI